VIQNHIKPTIFSPEKKRYFDLLKYDFTKSIHKQRVNITIRQFFNFSKIEPLSDAK